jgi:hypothetical protein
LANECPISTREITSGTTICNSCTKELAKRLQWMRRLGFPTLRDLVYKRVSFAQQSPRVGNRAYAPAPMDMEAEATYRHAETDLQVLGGMVDIKPLGTDRYGRRRALREWDQLIPMLLTYLSQLQNHPQIADGCETIRIDVERMKRHMTHPSEQKLVGICPECLKTTMYDQQGDSYDLRTPIYATPGTTYGECPQCGTMLDLTQVRAQYLDQLGGITFDGSLRDASDYMSDVTGVHVTNKTIYDWIRTGRMPNTSKIGRGEYRFSIGDLYKNTEREQS